MKNPATILIADRNPYVRKFLQREMHNAGYEVLLAENGRQVLFWVDRQAALNLVVLDPDLPDMDAATLLAKLHHQIPHLPVLVHGHPGEETDKLAGGRTWFVEKRGNSIERMLHMVSKILEHCG